MRIVHFDAGGVPGIAADEGSGWHGLTQRDGGFPGTLPELIAQGADLLRIGRSPEQSPAIDLNSVRLLPPVPVPPKILCVGLNYDDHLEESGLKKPAYPEIFARFATSLTEAMGVLAKKLTDEEITAVSLYYQQVRASAEAFDKTISSSKGE
jgi:acylpyruvate hydrolase